MANAHSFPLLRLPNLAREHVVKVMGVQEQYLFATLSKRAKIVTKIGVRKLSYDVDWGLESEYKLVLIQKAGTDEEFAINISTVHAADVAYQDVIQLKVEDITKTSLEQLAFLNDVFKISSFKIADGGNSNEPTKQFLIKVKDLKIGVDELLVARDNRDNEMFGWLMENCRDVKRLSNICRTTQNFQWDSQEPFTYEYLFLSNAPWITINHMERLFMNCNYFEIADGEHPLTLDDLNQFVKMWMNDSKMEFLGIDMGGEFAFHRILQDIVKEPVEEAWVENYLYSFDAGEAYKVRQKCGKEAVVCIDTPKFIITSHFENPRCDFWPYDEDEDEEEEEEAAD